MPAYLGTGSPAEKKDTLLLGRLTGGYSGTTDASGGSGEPRCTEGRSPCHLMRSMLQGLHAHSDSERKPGACVCLMEPSLEKEVLEE